MYKNVNVVTQPKSANAVPPKRVNVVIPMVSLLKLVKESVFLFLQVSMLSLLVLKESMLLYVVTPKTSQRVSVVIPSHVNVVTSSPKQVNLIAILSPLVLKESMLLFLRVSMLSLLVLKKPIIVCCYSNVVTPTP